MSLRPIETIGVDRIVEELRLQVFGPVYRLLERMPWPPAGMQRLPLLPREYLTLADPLAMFVCMRVGAIEGRTRSMGNVIGMEVFVPHGGRLEDGFLYQRFLVWLDGRMLKADPQERVRHTSGREVDPDIMVVRADGPSGMDSGLSSEVVHGVAGLIHVLGHGGAA